MKSFSFLLPWFETKYTGVNQFADKFFNELNVTDVLTKMHQRALLMLILVVLLLLLMLLLMMMLMLIHCTDVDDVTHALV